MQRKYVYLPALFLLGLLIGAFMAYSQTPTATHWVTPGQYPAIPSVIVWREGSNYFCKNSFGELLIGSPNASEIISYAITQAHALTQDVQRGALVLIKSGLYVTDSSIVGRTKVTLQGEGLSATIINGSAGNYPIFRGNFTGAPAYWLTIRDLTFRWGSYGVLLDEAYNSYLENVRCSSATYEGFHIEDCYASRSVHLIASGNGQAGINITHSHGFLGEGLTSISNGEEGITVKDTSSLSLKQYDIETNDGTGILIEGVRGGHIDGYVEFSGTGAGSVEVNITKGDLYTITDSFEVGESYIVGSGHANSHGIWISESEKVRVHSTYFYNVTNNVTLSTNSAAWVPHTVPITFNGGGLYVNSGAVTFGATDHYNVTHHLANLPDVVVVTPNGDLADKDFWVSHRNSTHFVIWTDQAVSLSFYWYAEYKP